METESETKKQTVSDLLTRVKTTAEISVTAVMLPLLLSPSQYSVYSTLYTACWAEDWLLEAKKDLLCGFLYTHKYLI